MPKESRAPYDRNNSGGRSNLQQQVNSLRRELREANEDIRFLKDRCLDYDRLWLVLLNSKFDEQRLFKEFFGGKAAFTCNPGKIRKEFEAFQELCY